MSCSSSITPLTVYLCFALATQEQKKAYELCSLDTCHKLFLRRLDKYDSSVNQAPRINSIWPNLALEFLIHTRLDTLEPAYTCSMRILAHALILSWQSRNNSISGVNQPKLTSHVPKSAFRKFPSWVRAIFWPYKSSLWPSSQLSTDVPGFV